MGKEEIVLDLNVDQGSMISELERTKKSIIQLKQEQQELTKAYKAGSVTVDEYASESVRLEAILKKEQATYNNTQKAVTGVKTKMDDLIQSVKTSAENINIAGVSVVDLTTKVTGLVNPITAAATAATALGFAYARSAKGANDLANAQNNIRAGLDSFFNRVGNETDGGLVERLTRRLNIASINLTTNTKKEAEARKDALRIAEIELKTLRELELDRIEAIGRQKNREREAEKARIDRDNQEKSFQERLDASKIVAEKIQGIETETVGILQKQINALISYGENTGAIVNGQILDRNLNIEILNLKNEIADKQEFVAGKLTENINAERAITKELNNQNKLRAENQKKFDEALKFKPSSEFDMTSFDPTAPQAEFDPQEQFDKDKEIIDAELGLVVSAEEQKQRELMKTNSVKEMIAEEDRKRLQANLEMTEENFNQLAGLFSQGSDARRVFGLASIGVDTAQAIAALTANSEENPANAFTFGGAGIAQYAAGLIRIFANIAAAKQFLDGGSFAGGADFITTKPTMIMVGDNPGHRERVTVEPLSGRGQSRYNKKAGHIALAGGGSVTYDPTSASVTNNINQSLATSNAIKNMPTPEVSVKEITKVQKRVSVKQNISRS